MDIQVLAQDASTFLAPLLPFLMQAGNEAAKDIGKKLSAAAVERVHGLWGALRPKLESKPAALEAAQDLALAPENEQIRGAFAWQIEKLLKEDFGFAIEIAQRLDEAKSVTVGALGERSVAVGGNVTNTQIITGDKNRIANS